MATVRVLNVGWTRAGFVALGAVLLAGAWVLTTADMPFVENTGWWAAPPFIAAALTVGLFPNAATRLASTSDRTLRLCISNAWKIGAFGLGGYLIAGAYSLDPVGDILTGNTPGLLGRAGSTVTLISITAAAVFLSGMLYLTRPKWSKTTRCYLSCLCQVSILAMLVLFVRYVIVLFG